MRLNEPCANPAAETPTGTERNKKTTNLYLKEGGFLSLDHILVRKRSRDSSHERLQHEKRRTEKNHKREWGDKQCEQNGEKRGKRIRGSLSYTLVKRIIQSSFLDIYF